MSKTFKVVTLSNEVFRVGAEKMEDVPAIMAGPKYNDGKGFKSDALATIYEDVQQQFTLLAQDKTSPRVVAFWILENIETAPEAKLKDALSKALAMRDHAHRKLAD